MHDPWDKGFHICRNWEAGNLESRQQAPKEKKKYSYLFSKTA